MAKKNKRVKNPSARVDQHRQTIGQTRSTVGLPGGAVVLDRATIPYRKKPLTEDEALNLICDARSDEPTYLLEKLLKKFKHELGD
jgi:hypothetical protein